MCGCVRLARRNTPFNVRNRTSILDLANYTPFNYRKSKLDQKGYCDYKVNDNETKITMFDGYEFDIVYKTVQYEMTTGYDL